MSEEKKPKQVEGGLSDKFYKMGAFALIMTSIIIFFGTLFLGAALLSKGATGGISGIQKASLVSSDLILKGILTAIFAMLFAIVFMLNDLLRILETKKI